jgi:26S proteasome regulatory subunit N1
MPPVVNKDHEDDLVVDLTAESDKKTDKNNVKKDTGKKKKKGDDLVQDPDAMSEEDKELKERLETCVSTVLNTSNDTSVTIPLRRKALDMIATELRSATSSMTSVPKPLKFLRPFYQDIKKLHEIIVIPPPSDINHIDLLLLRAKLADVLSVLAMTMGKPQARESLSFKLLGMNDYKILLAEGKLTEDIEDPSANLGSWGHEFVRSLAGEIGQEYNARVLKGDADPDDDAAFEDLLGMVDVIVPFHVKHNAEAEAVDLLIEVQRLKKLIDLDAIDESNYRRICLYLLKTADFMSDPEDLSVCSVLKYFYRPNTVIARNMG